MTASPRQPGLMLAFAFALREMRGGVRGFYVFIACLVLGVAMITAVNALSRGMTESLQNDGRYILGGDMAIRTPHAPVGDDVVAFLKETLGARVSIVTETRAMARSGDEQRATVVEVKAVEQNWPLFGAAQFGDAAGAPVDTATAGIFAENENGVPGAAVERDILPRLGLAVGDTLHIGTREFEIRAVILKEPDRIAGAGFTLAPRMLVSRESFGQTGLVAGDSLLEYGTRIALPVGADPAAAENALRAAFPDATWRVRNYLNASPRVERTINRLTLFLMLIGMTTLLVGGVGISNAVKSFLDSRMNDIATLKCLGAPRGFIFCVYLVQLLLLAALGIVLGLALGAAGAAVTGDVLLSRFNLSGGVGVYPDIMLLSAVFGVLVTLCFCLWPLGRALMARPTDLFRDMVAPAGGRPAAGIIAAIAVLAALLGVLVVQTATIPRYAFYFVFSAFGVFGIFYAASMLVQKIFAGRRAGAPELRMAMANVSRPGNATTSIILSLGLGLTVLVGMSQVEHSFSSLLKDDLAADVPSFFFLDIQADQRAHFESLLAAEPSARNVQMTPSFRGRIIAVNGVDAEKALVDRNEDWVVRSDRGFTYTAAQPAHSRIVEGAWWPADYKGPPLVSIATNVQRAFDIGTGDTLTVNILGMDITATVANVREIEWASFTMNFAVTFSPGVLETAPAPYIATAIVDAAAEERLQVALARALPTVTSVRVRDALETAQVMVRAVAEAVRFSAGVTLLAGVLVLAGGVAAARRRHVYDAVMLKVLGLTRRRVMVTFLVEYGFIGLITVSIAVVLGMACGYGALTVIMNIPFRPGLGAVVAVVLLCLGMTLVAGFAGTWRAMGQKPAPYLRQAQP